MQVKIKAKHLLHPFRSVSMVKNRIVGRVSILQCARRAQRLYSRDLRYNMQSVVDGYTSRITDSIDDTALLKRICAAYKPALANASSPGLYRPTGWWEEVRRSNLGPVMRALAAEDTVALQEMYRNFFRDACSAGLLIRAIDTSVANQCHFILGDALYRVDHWQEMVGDDFILADLQVPEIGNPFGVRIDGTFVRGGSEYQHYCAERVFRLVPDGAGRVAEIGGGYGGAAFYLLRDHSAVRYVNFDLPETIALNSYYLVKTLPQRSFVLYGEEASSDPAARKFDVALMPAQELRSLAPKSIDVTFSSHAISDLSTDALCEYLQQICRITAGHFLYIGNAAAGAKLTTLVEGRFPALALAESRESSWHKFRDPGAKEVELLFRSREH